MGSWVGPKLTITFSKLNLHRMHFQELIKKELKKAKILHEKTLCTLQPSTTLHSISVQSWKMNLQMAHNKTSHIPRTHLQKTPIQKMKHSLPCLWLKIQTPKWTTTIYNSKTRVTLERSTWWIRWVWWVNQIWIKMLQFEAIIKRAIAKMETTLQIWPQIMGNLLLLLSSTCVTVQLLYEKARQL